MSKIKRSKQYPVSVVIVCRNGMAVTRACLQGISTLNVSEIIIVDNNSDDGTAAMLKQFQKKDQRIKIIKNKNNNGFAEANNQGFELATSQYLLFLNNDTGIAEDFLPELIATLQDKQVAAVQPMILFPDGTIDSIGSYLTPTGFLYHRAHRLKPASSFLQEEQVYSMKGACMLWKKSVLDEIGVFDASYFAYFEETDLCHRAINAGYQVMVNPKGEIMHLGGFTSNTMNQERIQFHNAKNRMTTYLRHLPAKELILMFPFHLCLSELIVLKLVLSAQTALAWQVQKGILIGLAKGLNDRLHTLGNSRKVLANVTKKPDIQYYRALFTGLVGYTKVF